MKVPIMEMQEAYAKDQSGVKNAELFMLLMLNQRMDINVRGNGVNIVVSTTRKAQNV